ncbi:hypothetical protein Acr_17g0006050 [Actinidia rufa]|uniref:FRIGIDA-like protein n=1 Tax=Actinidia rufa TaxID=165716 RepID=A0A7J0G2M9_9ERIC|nr:hypothetical protein Acr_17g0006050 [Actinidia rufa]
MATIKTISAALKLVDVKKENLRKAFDDLQSHSSSLRSTTQQPEPQPSDQPPESARARPELRSFCENMDGLGLRKYMIDRPDSRFVIKAELPDALRHAPDAPTMVVDAMTGFYAPDSKKNKKGDKDGAKKIAMDWKRNMSVNGDNPLEVLGFLHLLATYGLADCFSVEDLVDFTVVIARFHQSVELCRVLAFGDRISAPCAGWRYKHHLVLPMVLLFPTCQAESDFPADVPPLVVPRYNIAVDVIMDYDDDTLMKNALVADQVSPKVYASLEVPIGVPAVHSSAPVDLSRAIVFSGWISQSNEYHVFFAACAVEALFNLQACNDTMSAARPDLLGVLGSLLIQLEETLFGHANLETCDDFLHRVNDLERNRFNLGWLCAHLKLAHTRKAMYAAEQHILIRKHGYFKKVTVRVPGTGTGTAPVRQKSTRYGKKYRLNGASVSQAAKPRDIERTTSYKLTRNMNL